MYSISTDPTLRRRRIKKRERNLVAAVLEIIVIATLATALAQPHWFFLVGGSCSRSFLGASLFFYIGYFESKQVSSTGIPSTTLLYHGNNEVLEDCVTPHIVILFRVTIALIFLAITSSFIQFLFDVVGTNQRILRMLRRNAIGSIVTVIFCVCIIGVCYCMSMLMEHQQKIKRVHDGAKVMVKFHVSYYLITGAGAIAVLASAANLVRRYPSSFLSRQSHRFSRRILSTDENALINEYDDGQETFAIPQNSMYEPMLAPPYSRWPVSDSTQIHPPSPPPYSP